VSELIDNRRHRIEALKTMIKELHEGAEVQALQGRFRAVLDHAGAAEISAMESELMAEGMPEQEIRRMCELHVAVFRDTLEQRPAPHTLPGHPVHTFMKENRAILELTAAYRAALAAGDLAAATALHGRLAAVDGHYKRKEYLVFPFLEKAGIGAPPKVMWGVDDQVRELLAAGGDALASAGELGAEELALVREVVLEPMLAAIDGMVEKEDRVLWPMALEHLADADWGAVQQQWDELGAGLVEPEEGWRPAPAGAPASVAAVAGDDAVAFPSGYLTPRQLRAILDTLPLDVTFVDADDRVAYFSEGRERVFARNRAIVGRRVQDCHPPASMHVVQQIVDDLRSGARDVAEFWIDLHGRFVHIRYLAVRDEDGRYLGCLEATQDVTPIRALTGERRLLAEAPAAGR
jgi:DUF438 domain-containing protein